MAKNVYPVVDGVTRKQKKAYVVIDNVTRNIKKMYAVVNGVIRLIWEEGNEAPVGFIYKSSSYGSNMLTFIDMETLSVDNSVCDISNSSIVMSSDGKTIVYSECGLSADNHSVFNLTVYTFDDSTKKFVKKNSTNIGAQIYRACGNSSCDTVDIDMEISYDGSRLLIAVAGNRLISTGNSEQGTSDMYQGVAGYVFCNISNGTLTAEPGVAYSGNTFGDDGDYSYLSLADPVSNGIDVCSQDLTKWSLSSYQRRQIGGTDHSVSDTCFNGVSAPSNQYRYYITSDNKYFITYTHTNISSINKQLYVYALTDSGTTSIGYVTWSYSYYGTRLFYNPKTERLLASAVSSTGSTSISVFQISTSTFTRLGTFTFPENMYITAISEDFIHMFYSPNSEKTSLYYCNLSQDGVGVINGMTNVMNTGAKASITSTSTLFDYAFMYK